MKTKSQYQLITDHIKEFGSILPAKKGGDKYGSGMFGSEISRRCRELRASGKLVSQRDGRFVRFFLNKKKK